MRGLPAIAAVCLLACNGDGASNSLTVDVVAEQNPLNVLSQRLRVHAPGGATAVGEWSEDGIVRRSAPTQVSAGGEAVVHLLGLRPSTRYRAVVEIEGPAGTQRSDPVTFTTGPLPPELAQVSLSVSGDPPDGYLLVDLLTGSPGILVAFDGRGELRWYRAFEGAAPVVEAKQLPGGNILAFLGSSTGWNPVHGEYLELAPSGEVLRTFRATPPLYTDGHEALLTDPGTADERLHLFGYESRMVDLAPFGLSGTGPVVGHNLQRLRADGEAEFDWSAFDHVGFDELVNPVSGSILDGDYDHPNSLHIDSQGNYLVSFRNLDALFLVHRDTGDVLWRLGGNRSDFTILDDPLRGFSGQHDARFLPDGNLLLFDNGTLHDPPTTRAVEYELDLGARTARRVWEFRAAAFNAFTGSAVRDDAGTTWVGLSMTGEVVRVARDGTTLWTARLSRRGEPAAFYRAVPIGSLYGACEGCR